MQPEDVKAMIEAGFPGAEVRVEGDGSHFEAVVVSPEFEGKTRIWREQALNAIVFDKITSGEIHAFHPRAYTPEEWEKASKLKIS